MSFNWALNWVICELDYNFPRWPPIFARFFLRNPRGRSQFARFNDLLLFVWSDQCSFSNCTSQRIFSSLICKWIPGWFRGPCCCQCPAVSGIPCYIFVHIILPVFFVEFYQYSKDIFHCHCPALLLGIEYGDESFPLFFPRSADIFQRLRVFSCQSAFIQVFEKLTALLFFLYSISGCWWRWTRWGKPLVTPVCRKILELLRSHPVSYVYFDWTEDLTVIGMWNSSTRKEHFFNFTQAVPVVYSKAPSSEVVRFYFYQDDDDDGPDIMRENVLLQHTKK